MPGLALGGPMRADASAGRTGVFVNGRDLHSDDVLLLEQIIGPIQLGGYWLDAQGNYGYEDVPFTLGNIPATFAFWWGAWRHSEHL